MLIEKIKELVSSPDVSVEARIEAINSMDHFEIARRLHGISAEEKSLIFNSLDSDQKRQELLYQTDHDSRLEIQENLDRDYLAKLIDNMPEDEATDILQEFDEKDRADILSKMGSQDADIIKNLITYQQETAGGLMSPHFKKVQKGQMAGDIMGKLRKEPKNERPQYFYVVNNHAELLGFFELRDLLNVPKSSAAYQLVHERTPKVFLDDPCEKIAHLMDKEHLSVLPVVDGKNIIHGIVTFDDVIHMMEDAASEDIFKMVGTAEVDPFAKKPINKILARAPWLLTTFMGGLISASILSHFETSLTHFATIIFFVPFVLGLSGNIGIQGATVIVRGLATGDIQSDNISKVIKSELLVGISNGIIFGILSGGLVASISKTMLHSDPILGLVVGAGIILAVAVASLIGSLCPLYFLRMKIDPAISTGPFVTVTNDFIGVGIYLSTATLIYSIL